MPKKKPLWTCPRCGHRFVTRNMSHSCGRYRLADHLAGKDPLVRRLFNGLRDMARENGPVTVYAQKTRIVFQNRGRFISLVPRKHWLDCGLWLKRRVEHHRVRRIEPVPPHDYVHHVCLTKPDEIDQELAALVREAYAVGCQEYHGAPAANACAVSECRREIPSPSP